MNTLQWRRVRLFGYLAVASVASSFFVGIAYGGDRNEFESRLKAVSNRVDAVEGEIRGLKQEYSKLVVERKGLESTLITNQRDETKLVSELKKLSAQRDVVSQQLAGARTVLQQQESKVRARVRALYVSSSYASYSEVFFRSGGDEIERLAIYAKALKRHDESLFKDLREKVNAVSSSERELLHNETAQREAQSELLRKRGELEGAIVRTKEIAEEIAAKKKQAEKALNKLRQEAEYLESLIERFTAVESPPEVTQPQVVEESHISVDSVETAGPTPTLPQQPLVVAAESPAPRDGKVVDASHADMEEKVELKGLPLKGASLQSPVNAKIVQPFGKGKGSTFAELVSSKGIDCEAPIGARVEVVAAGRVAFVGPMPGFGTVVVVDHGQRHYSLYGRLSESMVSKGMLLPARRAVGTTSELNEKGRNFYLEIRRDGNPVNPEGVVSGLRR